MDTRDDPQFSTDPVKAIDQVAGFLEELSGTLDKRKLFLSAERTRNRANALRAMLAAGVLAVGTVAAEAKSLLIAGDCIATRQGVAAYFPEADVNAKMGVGAANIVGRIRAGYAEVVISAVTNDITRVTPRAAIARKQKEVTGYLAQMRARAGGAHITWLIPAYGPAAKPVADFARAHGDDAVSFRAGADGYHPANYRSVAGAVRARLGSFATGSVR